MRLTIPQLAALATLSEYGKLPAYLAGARSDVLRNLSKKGLAECQSGSGSNSVWEITPAGRAIIAGDQG